MCSRSRLLNVFLHGFGHRYTNAQGIANVTFEVTSVPTDQNNLTFVIEALTIGETSLCMLQLEAFAGSFQPCVCPVWRGRNVMHSMLCWHMPSNEYLI